MMGGVPNPTKDVLLAMHEGPYILHARGGELRKVPVEKSRLPIDGLPFAHQRINMAMASDGTIYFPHLGMMSRSTDGGRTWSVNERGVGPDGEQTWLRFQVLNDGTFVTTGSQNEGSVVKIYASSDEGRTWQLISQIEVPGEFQKFTETYPNIGVLGLVYRGINDELVCMINAHTNEHGKDWSWVSGEPTLLSYRSTDKGITWQSPSKIMNWACGEGGVARAPSGRLLLAIRYQRPMLPGDPPDLIERTGAARIDAKFPYKHLFLVDSLDDGHSWQNPRQLTTVFGQCYGYPVALNDSSVVVIHTTPYGPGERGSRAMISHDEGRTWGNETYYMTFSTESGYNQSVALKDGTILTISARDDTDPYTVIRWKPVTGTGTVRR